MRAAVRAVVPMVVLRRLRAVRLALWALVDRLGGGGPARGYAGLVGGGDYDAVGQELVGYFRDLGGLRPTDDVLDIGCGIGRMATPLTTYLAEGSYHGFDVVGPMIRSAQRRFAEHDRFAFEYVDVFNGKYNPGGTIQPVDLRFPYADQQFDFAFATSVFTHMVAADVERYLAETARVLRPGGTLVATWFVMTAEAERLVVAGTSDIAFRDRQGDVWHADPREPELAIAYAPETLRGLYAAAGLELEEPIRFGTWSGQDGLTYQDLAVARRA